MLSDHEIRNTVRVFTVDINCIIWTHSSTSSETSASAGLQDANPTIRDAAAPNSDCLPSLAGSRRVAPVRRCVHPGSNAPAV